MISENAGLDASVVVNRVRESKYELGLNAETGEYVDMLKTGIVDPAKVVRSALQNAASISGTLLTTEVLVTDIPEKDKPMPQMPQGGMGGMY